MNSKRILNIVTIVLFLITVVILGLFMFGGEIPNQLYDTPIYTGALLNWAYVLFGIATIALSFSRLHVYSPVLNKL